MQLTKKMLSEDFLCYYINGLLRRPCGAGTFWDLEKKCHEIKSLTSLVSLSSLISFSWHLYILISVALIVTNHEVVPCSHFKFLLFFLSLLFVGWPAESLNCQSSTQRERERETKMKPCFAIHFFPFLVLLLLPVPRARAILNSKFSFSLSPCSNPFISCLHIKIHNLFICSGS